MTTLALNKTSLKEQRDQLVLYERFLPSLDLKRQQLIAEYQRAITQLAATEQEYSQLVESQEGLFSLFGASEMDLSQLVRVRSVELTTENVLGVDLPVPGNTELDVASYSTLSCPFWVDFLVQLLRDLASLHIHRQVQRERVKRLNDAVRRITQRVNLFDKVLIPRAQQNIQRIRIYLGDAERAAVVRSKIAKAKQETPRQARERR